MSTSQTDVSQERAPINLSSEEGIVEIPLMLESKIPTQLVNYFYTQIILLSTMLHPTFVWM
jgi:hypothetical protein